MGKLQSVTLASLPYAACDDAQLFELTEASGRLLSGVYVNGRTHNRFEVSVLYEDGRGEWFSVLATQPYSGGNSELAGENCSFQVSLDQAYASVTFFFRFSPELDFELRRPQTPMPHGRPMDAASTDKILFDVSDLVYYIGHHDNLTGIQRVQACILLGLIEHRPDQKRSYITYDNDQGNFIVVDPTFFEELLVDLSRPVAQRKIVFDKPKARIGILPDSQPIATELASSQDERLIVYLLGAAWVNRDYFHRILDLKRTYNAVFCMTIHDLIPIFARETCDQGTATVFEEFLRKSFLFTDHYVAVSEYTAYDLHRFASSVGRRNLAVSVVENAHTLDEFVPPRSGRTRSPVNGRYVLFVSTIEGRKNHSYIFDVWARLTETLKEVPILVCVGRLGWRAEVFLEKMLVSNNLQNKIRVMSDVSDTQLDMLYENCLFSVYPSVYEGWGLPVGESLSKGKLCVSSDRSSIPEVGGEFGIYVDINSVEDGVREMRKLIEDDDYRVGLETALRERFVPRTWTAVASDLTSLLTRLPPSIPGNFPQLKLGREYKLAHLPPRNFSALGSAMIAQVEGARKARLTGYINRDDDLLLAQAMRSGARWCSPEDWGTWSRYPECEKLFYIRDVRSDSEIIVYEKLRVVAPLVGHSLRVSLNDGPTQEFHIDDEQFLIRIAGPIHALQNGCAEFRITYEFTASPEATAQLEQIDRRKLGLGFESMLIIDDDNVVARIAMLERVLFGGFAGQALVQRDNRVKRTIQAEASGDGGRSLLVRSQGGLQRVDTGDQRSLNAPQVEIGENVALTAGEATRSGSEVGLLLGRGWFPVESGGAWSDGYEATLQFRLQELSDPAFALCLEVRCLASRTKPVKVSVIVNDVFVGSEQLFDGEFTTLRYVVDSSICADDRAFVVLVHCDRPVTPASVGGGSDTRTLGVQVRGMRIEMLQRISTRETYNLSEPNAITSALASGWHPLEVHGVWCKEEGGRIMGIIDLPPKPDQRNVRLTIYGRVLGADNSTAARVDVLIQGQVLATWTFEDDTSTAKHAIIPLLSISDCYLLDVTMVRRGAASPQELGRGDDTRKLGLLVSQALIEDVEFPANEEALPLDW